MNRLIMIGRLAAFMAILGGAGMAWAADPGLPLPIPDDMARWPVVALMAFITVMALSVAALCICKAFASLGQVGILVSQGAEHVRRMDEIAGKIGEIASRPCGMSGPVFREWLRKEAGK